MAYNNLLLTSLLLGVFCALSIIIWRAQTQKRRKEEDVRSLKKEIKASFSLSGYLLEAQDEETIISTAMHSIYTLLRAEGCAFVPFSEWEQNLPVLKHGNLPFLQEETWQARLSEPATRHTCRNCRDKQAGSECVLLQKQISSASKNVYCVSLRNSGREVGIVSYFFDEIPSVSESHQLFIAELVRTTDLALSSLHQQSQKLNSLRQLQQSGSTKEFSVALKTENQELLSELEYQAVLKERTRLAREIHDGLAQTLAFLKMETARMQIYTSKGDVVLIDEALQACHQTLSEAYLDVRQSIDNLRRVPSENLTDWLDATASDFKILTGLTIDMSNVKLASSFPNKIKAQLIRIAQEALTNIRKHAQPSEVAIAAFEHEGEIIIEIKDNGSGFSPDEIRTSSRYGLRSMRERAEAINAEFQIISAPNMGTTIRLRIPISEKINS